MKVSVVPYIHDSPPHQHGIAQGMIEEEAAVKCGGLPQLKVAVAAGRVKEFMHKGIHMFLFPRITVGRYQHATVTRQISRVKAISNKDYDAIASTMGELGWDVLPLKDLQAEQARTGSLPEDLVAKLIKCESKYSQALKACQKTFKAYEDKKKDEGIPLAFHIPSNTLNPNPRPAALLVTCSVPPPSPSPHPSTEASLAHKTLCIHVRSFDGSF